MSKTTLPTRVKATFLFLFCFASSIQIFAQLPDLKYSPFIGSSAGLTFPMELTTAPGEGNYNGRLFIVEKRGYIRLWSGSSVLATPFLDINSRVANDDAGEQGLLSMAFHPDYQTNGFFFVYYNNNAGEIVVERYKVSANPNVANPVADPPVNIITIPKPFTNHNGGHLQFRVEGGVNYLYFATGDGGSGNDPLRNAQNPASYLGKMIRINVDQPPYTPVIWAWGLRNPFRWSFDRATNDMWIGDVGQSAREEIDFNAGGAFGVNYGWPCVEGMQNNGSAPANSRCDTITPVDLLPVYDYDNPTEGSSVVGGYVYRGSDYPELQGYYLATDFYSGRMWFIKPNNPGPGWDIQVKTGFATGISSISESGDGNLFALSLYTNEVFLLVLPIVTPLDLVSFSGKSLTGYNELKWIAVSEQNIDKYIIEYSTDGRAYTAAGEVVSLNNGNRNTYSFRHNLNNNSIVYYRLRMNESTGSFKYSAVIQVGGEVKKEIRVYPTVVVNNMLNIVSGEPISEITILSTEGRLVWKRQMNGAEGYFSISFPTLQKGTYLVRIAAKDRIQTEKIIIQ